MLKYYTYDLTFSEVPDEVNLCFSITNCQNRCEGCHSAFLRDDIGFELDYSELSLILNRHKGQFTCVCFLGEGNDKQALQEAITFVHNKGYKTCLYSGRNSVDFSEYRDLNYLKIGSYNSAAGPLNKKTTNQRMYRKNDINSQWEDITFKFWYDATWDTWEGGLKKGESPYY